MLVASQVELVVKNPPAMQKLQEMQVRSLGRDFLPSIFLSIRVFSKESVLHVRWLKYWSFSIIPSNEYSVLISSRLVSRTEFSSPGATGTRGCIPDSPGESGLVSRASQGLRSPLESRRGSLGAP